MKSIRVGLGTLLMTVAASLTAQAQDMVRSERTVSLALANKLVTSAVEACSQNGYRVVATVVDRSGFLKASQRSDNANPHTIELAQRKAYTAAMLRYDTNTLAANIAKGIGSSNLAGMPGYTSLLGGFPIKAGNEVVGGIGVSGAPGGDLDTECVKVALAAAADELK